MSLDALYEEVHHLAIHYHWSAKDILSMTRSRRKSLGRIGSAFTSIRCLLNSLCSFAYLDHETNLREGLIQHACGGVFTVYLGQTQADRVVLI